VTMTGAELRRLRRAAGLTQADLASRAGVYRTVLSVADAAGRMRAITNETKSAFVISKDRNDSVLGGY
jgi:transcriptional regulator with XRE-family HTH domain